MKHDLSKASALFTAVGLALTMQAGANAQDKELPQVVKDNIARATAQNLEKCYGVNAIGKNDCAVGKHACAGLATKARDPKSIVLLPAGTCEKIAGGSTKEG
ncbi:DUF2282 domain-containing protein [Chitinimonas sp.]|uniref:DUF2282 domain-containing protein n=1 Tax=Chitinimonas sp. TaxID=1934313 RepID=UPI002F9521A3